MITALEAKMIAFRRRKYYSIVERKITEAANSGDIQCAIHLDEIPYGTHGILYEIAGLLYELGYKTNIEDQKMYIYWYPQRPVYHNVDRIEEEN